MTDLCWLLEPLIFGSFVSFPEKSKRAQQSAKEHLCVKLQTTKLETRFGNSEEEGFCRALPLWNLDNSVSAAEKNFHRIIYGVWQEPPLPVQGQGHVCGLFNPGSLKNSGESTGALTEYNGCPEKKSTKINFLGPETARWGGGLPREGVVAEKFVLSLESLSCLGFEERNLGCPGNFAGMSRTPGGV